MDLIVIAEELGVPVESLTKENKPMLDKYLAKKPEEISPTPD